MANFIIGTAGHIDHGKTTIIKRLTGIETDRWEEEKKRGITIDLGFAYFDLPNGQRAGIIDVPGHEKFIKNMLAGVSGIDLVLFVVSADEGIMPQSQEHLDILNLLELKSGIVLLNKADLVDEDWLEIITEDVRGKIKGTFLEDAPILPISAITGQGFDQLIQRIQNYADQMTKEERVGAPRIPVDRVFTSTGFGTIITGTLLDGDLNVGDDVVLFPKEIPTKVKNIQVHGEKVDSAHSGQRVAVNLANVKKDEIHRGDVLAYDNTIKSTHMIDGKLKLLESSTRELFNWTRLRLYHGSKEVLCRLVLLDREVLKPGEEAFVQFRLEEKTACRFGDRFVVRFYSPLETIGGGLILDPNAAKHKRFKDNILHDLEMKSQGDPSAVIEKALERLSKEFPTVADIVKQSGTQEETVQTVLRTMIEEGAAYEINGKHYVHQVFIEQLEEKLLRLLSDYHEKYPARTGLKKDEIKSKLLQGVSSKVFDSLLAFIVSADSKSFKMVGPVVSLTQFSATLPARDQKIADQIVKLYKTTGYKPMNMSEVFTQLRLSKKDQEIINYLLESRILIRINDSIYLMAEDYDAAKQALIDFIGAKGEIALSDYRDLLDTSRKIAVALLEHFDDIKVTKRLENTRVLY
ncbi:MAG: selenocysteine-specific translation elongation factor [Clostridia bacterium]|nr:selenocysteine-specific translation elongation factor [Clostridia bacterium]